MTYMVHTLVKKEMQRHNRIVNNMIREGLEKWVSEIEPVIMYRQGEILPFGVGVQNSQEPIIHLMEPVFDDMK